MFRNPNEVEMPLNAFKMSDLNVVPKEGGVAVPTKGIVSGSNLIVIQDTSIPLKVGDEIRRGLPNGQEEAFEVLDPVFYDEESLGPHYQVKVQRKGAYQAGMGGNYTFNVNGPNARVNFHSTDNSQNIVADRAVFGELRQAVENGIRDDGERAKLMQHIAEMEKSAGGSNFIKAYQDFMATAANHMSVIGPFLPALTSFLG
jgi:hypothetical protein